MVEKLNKGLREHQTNKAVESQLEILRILSYDEDWHRYGELQRDTKLSTKTLSKQLHKLEEMKLIEKDENESGKYSFTHSVAESGKYPYPVYYRLNPVYVNAFRGYSQEKPTDKLEELKKRLLEERNPLTVMKEINQSNNITLLGILLFLKQNRSVDDKVKRLLLEYLVWSRYKSLTWRLIEETEKIIDSIDIKKLVLEA
jgi:DNA-binding MarR family transcriptional regulator